MKDQSKKKDTLIKESASREYAESIFNAVREPLIVLDQDLRVVTASRSFYEFFKVKPEETEGQLIYDLGNKQWDVPKLRELLETILPEKTTFDNYEVEHDFATIGRRTMLLNARQIKKMLGKERIILLAIEDITERKRLENLLTESEERYRHLFETASDGIVLLEKHEGKIINTNPAAEKMLGYSKKESIGNKLQDIGIFDIDDFPMIMHNLNKDGIIKYADVPATTKSGQQIDADIYLVDRAKLVQCNIRDITDRMRAERSLAENEARLRTLVQTIPNLIWLKDADGVYLSCNTMFERFFGAKEADIFGKTDYDFVDRELADFFREHDRKAMAAGKPSANEEWLTFADDGYRGLFDTIKTPMYDAEGKLIGVLGISHDITERKQAEEEHKAHIRFLESLERIDQAIKEETDVEQMLRHILQAVFSIFDCDRAWLFYPCDPDAPTFRVPMEICRPEYPGAKVLNVDVPMSPDMAQNLREALASDDPVIYIAGTEKPINKVSDEQFGVQSQMFVALYPKLGKSWVFGMHQCSYPRIWTEEEQKLFKEISRRISDGLSSVLYLRELQENEARLSEAQRLAQIGSWEWDAIADTITWSEEYYRIYGFDPTQHPPGYEEHLKAYTPESAMQLDAAVKRNMQTGEPYELDLELANPKGPCRWITARSETMRDAQGKIIGLRGTAQDITERKRAEENLRNEHMMLERTESIAQVGSWEWDIATDTVTWSDELFRIFQLDPREGAPSFAKHPAFYHPDDMARLQQAVAAAVAKGTPYELELRAIRKDGETRVCIARGIAKMEPDGRRAVRLFGSLQDITERKRAEDELRMSEERFRALHDASFGGIGIHDKGVILDCNQGLADMTGYTLDELVGMNGLGLIAPAWRDHVMEKILSDYEKPYEVEGLRKDGSIYALQIQGKSIPYHGQRVRVTEFRDITERKRAEETLRKRNEELERFEQAVIGRELKMIELKKRIAELEEKNHDKKGDRHES
jgi:PAS domain S-box-containing protein